MNLFSISFSWHSVSVSLNLCMLLLCMALFLLFKYRYNIPYISKLCRGTYHVQEFQLTLGSVASFTICCDTKVQEIAYKIWIELITRKIGLELDDDDVLEEVYDSWYSAFDVIRNLLKDIPADRLNDSFKLIDLTVQVLNQGLRPHLTKWQAKYRVWLLKAQDKAKEKDVNVDEDTTPQNLQKQFPQYDELIKDMRETNRRMIKFANLMKDIAYRSNSL